MYLEQVSKDNNSDDGGFTKLPNNFLKKWTKTLGKGPVLLYLQLSTYCHKNNAIVWPALKTLGDDLGMSKNSIINYQKILLRNGLIQKIKRRKYNGNYHSNLYRLTPIAGAKNGPNGVQKLDLPSPTIGFYQVQNLHPNKNNKNKNHRTTTRGKVVVDFKKLKEREKKKMQDKQEHKRHTLEQALRKRMVTLDFSDRFIDETIREHSPEKVEEKLDLMMAQKNIQNHTGWLYNALKKDYQNPHEAYAESEHQVRKQKHADACRGKMEAVSETLSEFGKDGKNKDKNKEDAAKQRQVSRQIALNSIRMIREELSQAGPLTMRSNKYFSKGEKLCQI